MAKEFIHWSINSQTEKKSVFIVNELNTKFAVFF